MLYEVITAWSAVKLGEQWLLRQDATSGLVAEESWLAALLASYVPPPSVASFSPPPVEVAGQWQVLPPELPMQLLAQGATEPRFNLLQGAFRLQPEWARLLLPWRKVMLARITSYNVCYTKLLRTLYAALSEINSRDRNILTVERNNFV